MSHYIQTKFTRARLPLSRVLKVPWDSRRGVRAVAVERDSSGSQFDWNLLLLQILRRRVAREHVGPSLGVRMSRAGEGPHCTPGFDLLSARPVSRENDLMGKVDIHLFSSSCLNQAIQMQTGTGLAHRFQDGLTVASIQARMLIPRAASLQKSNTGTYQHASFSSHFWER